MRQIIVHRNAHRPKTERAGMSIVVYLDATLNKRLNALLRERNVGRSLIIRMAVERPLKQLESGRLDLPLGT